MKNLFNIARTLLFINILFLEIGTLAFSQNLVPNPGFEYKSSCPDDDNQFEIVDNWWSPFGTPCYFNKCNDFQTKYRRVYPLEEESYNVVPVSPHTGDGYAGIYISIVLHDEFQDYLMTELESPLEEGESYIVSMYVRLGDVWRYIDKIGAYFSIDRYEVSKRQLITYSSGYEEIYDRCSLIFKEDTVLLTNETNKLNSRDEWMKITGVYKAKGGESFITIGNFHIIRQIWKTIIYPVDIKEDFEYEKYMNAYYYIDDISVTKLLNNDTSLNQVRYDDFVETILVGESVTLDNIFFDSDKATLKPLSFSVLRLLKTYLDKNPSVKIEIYGHTDNIGNSDMNLKLSKERAEAIVNYLICEGIDMDRIRHYGYGSQSPIVSNNTEDGRQQNRRVEFKIIR